MKVNQDKSTKKQTGLQMADLYYDDVYIIYKNFMRSNCFILS